MLKKIRAQFKIFFAQITIQRVIMHFVDDADFHVNGIKHVKCMQYIVGIHPALHKATGSKMNGTNVFGYC